MLNKGTEIILKNIKDKTGKEVTIKNLDGFLKQKVVILRMRIGWARTNISLTSKQMGINPQDEEMMEFVNEHFKSGKISIIPDKYNKKLRSLESGMRYFIKANAIGYDYQAIPITKLDKFLKKYEKTKEEFFQVRDEVYLKYDNIVEGTLLKLEIMFDDMGIEEKDKKIFIKSIERRIPTKEEFYSSFIFDYIPEMFPELYTELIGEEEKEKHMENFIKETFETSLNLALNTANNIIEKIEKDGYIKGKTIEQIDNTTKALEENNIFYSKEIENIIKLFEEIKTTHNNDEKAEIAEEILVTIYLIDKKLGIKLDYSKIDYSESELKAIASIVA